MNATQQKTLEAIFENPVRSDVAWREIESLLAACGAVITAGKGSRVRIVLNGVRAVFHRPHPKKETGKGALKAMRRFSKSAGVQP